jgi:transposase
MRVYVGMDVHRKRSQVALVDEHGGQLLNRNLANDSAELTSLLGRLEAGTPVAFEAAYGWGWLAELLEELELEPHLVHPSRCKAIASARLKDDRVDARTLAQLLRAELLPEAWIAPQAVRDQRGLLRTGPHWFGWPPRSSAGCMRSWPTGASGSPSRCGARPVGPGWLSFPCRRCSGPS